MFLELVFIVACACLFVWNIRPELILQLRSKFEIWSAGLTVKTHRLSGFQWNYLERGTPNKKKSSLVLLHGFSMQGNAWAKMCRHLPLDLHIVIPDLPGHGATDRIHPPEDLFTALVDKVHEFIQVVGLESCPIHIVGLSMGGAITTCYAAMYPQNVKGASILCPSLRTPTPSTMVREMQDDGIKILIDFTEAGIKRLVSMATFNAPKVPDQLIKGMQRISKPHQDFFVTLHEKLLSPVALDRPIQGGEQDEILHVSGAEVLKKNLPNVKDVQILSQCGHLIMLEQPVKLAELLLKFREKYVHKPSKLKSFKKKAMNALENVAEFVMEDDDDF